MDRTMIAIVNRAQMLPLYFAEMISSDVLTSVEVCERNQQDLMQTIEEIPLTSLSDEEKAKWIDMGRKGLEIIERDKKELTCKHC